MTSWFALRSTRGSPARVDVELVDAAHEERPRLPRQQRDEPRVDGCAGSILSTSSVDSRTSVAPTAVTVTA